MGKSNSPVNTDYYPIYHYINGVDYVQSKHIFFGLPCPSVVGNNIYHWNLNVLDLKCFNGAWTEDQGWSAPSPKDANDYTQTQETLIGSACSVHFVNLSRFWMVCINNVWHRHKLDIELNSKCKNNYWCRTNQRYECDLSSEECRLKNNQECLVQTDPDNIGGKNQCMSSSSCVCHGAGSCFCQ